MSRGRLGKRDVSRLLKREIRTILCAIATYVRLQFLRNKCAHSKSLPRDTFLISCCALLKTEGGWCPSTHVSSKSFRLRAGRTGKTAKLVICEHEEKNAAGLSAKMTDEQQMSHNIPEWHLTLTRDFIGNSRVLCSFFGFK